MLSALSNYQGMLIQDSVGQKILVIESNGRTLEKVGHLIPRKFIRIDTIWTLNDLYEGREIYPKSVLPIYIGFGLANATQAPRF